ncbi:MAG: YidC/Oxa1 family membrane protein insertase [Actinobacteria bacterium]|nr:YidC/Oxa1 family membrane protein insertase [Actinomycetota bacterium]
MSVWVIAGILSPLESVFRHILDWLHSTIGLPWAWSIVALTVIVRMILVPLTVKQIHSMQNLQRHAPQMKEIQKKYKQDKRKQQEELMKFYKENSINPAASCLPLLAQFPVFIALYFVLRTFAKEAGQPGSAIFGDDFNWLGLIDITKHASHGWGPLLLVIYAGSQVASTFFMSATMNKGQRYLMMALPLVFITFIMRFPAGLVLYWATTNLWTVGQGIVTRQLMPKTPAPNLFQRRTSKPAPEDSGDGAKPPKPVEPAPAPKPAVAAAAGPRPVRKVKRKKKRARR